MAKTAKVTQTTVKKAPSAVNKSAASGRFTATTGNQKRSTTAVREVFGAARPSIIGRARIRAAVKAVSKG